MSKTFGTLKTNVCNEIGDTDAEMKEIVGVYINNRYHQILRATNWEVYDDDYSITTVVDTATYTLPSDFGKELYAIDSTNDTKLKRMSLQALIEDNPSQYDQQGTLTAYAVYRDEDDNMKVRFFNVPDSIISVLFPYTVRPAKMTDDDNDSPIGTFDDLIEIGAKADAWRYKRQFTKAQYFELLFSKELDSYMFDMEHQPNSSAVFSAVPYDRESLV